MFIRIYDVCMMLMKFIFLRGTNFVAILNRLTSKIFSVDFYICGLFRHFAGDY
jgi:hypothetical protein